MTKAKHQSQSAIAPTIGRQVWFWVSGEKRTKSADDTTLQPEAATVVYVSDEHCVNLQVIDAKGRARVVRDAQVVADDEWDDSTGPHCQWVPAPGQGHAAT